MKKKRFSEGLIKKEKLWNDIVENFKTKGHAVQGKMLVESLGI